MVWILFTSTFVIAKLYQSVHLAKNCIGTLKHMIETALFEISFPFLEDSNTFAALLS